ncbi:hypothetical protein DYB31_015099 [Aphanomyces astaci]|uniref:Uncharacterized protein n=2 Tax=Aphanomyces astaci TaxID=112090 RepID=A0A397EM98_APHAT|nr:hypothetical protein DYB31_015099 [Aphanomyces astaci]
MRAVHTILAAALLAACAPSSASVAVIEELFPCDAQDCHPNGSNPISTVESCLKACNGGSANECKEQCMCTSSGTTPGSQCAGICRKNKSEDECGKPVRQKCAGADLVCDKSTQTPGPTTANPATTAAPTTNSPTTVVVTTPVPTTAEVTTVVPETTAVPSTTLPVTTAIPTTTAVPSTTLPVTTAIPVTTATPITTATPTTTTTPAPNTTTTPTPNTTTTATPATTTTPVNTTIPVTTHVPTSSPAPTSTSAAPVTTTPPPTSSTAPSSSVTPTVRPSSAPVTPSPSPPPTCTQTPPTDPCTPVSVVGDATYCVVGAVCGGTGRSCPKKGAVTTIDCYSHLASYVQATNSCVAGFTSVCQPLHRASATVYACMFDPTIVDSVPPSSPTPSPGLNLNANPLPPCTDVSVVGDATYCIPGDICGGNGTNCPKKGDVATKGCLQKLPSYKDADQCVAPSDAVCRNIHGSVLGCVFP